MHTKRRAYRKNTFGRSTVPIIDNAVKVCGASDPSLRITRNYDTQVKLLVYICSVCNFVIYSNVSRSIDIIDNFSGS